MSKKREPITVQREAVRQEKATELELRTRVTFAALRVRNLKEYTDKTRANNIPPAVEVRLRDGRTIHMDVDNALSCLLRGAGTLVWEEAQGEQP